MDEVPEIEPGELERALDTESVQETARAVDAATEKVQNATEKTARDNALAELETARNTHGAAVIEALSKGITVDITDIRNISATVDDVIKESPPVDLNDVGTEEKINQLTQAVEEMGKKLDKILNDKPPEEAAKTKSVLEKVRDMLKSIAGSAEKITENSEKGEGTPAEKASTKGIMDKIAMLLKVMTGLGAIAGMIFAYIVLKDIAEAKTGCYQYLADGSEKQLGGECHDFYKANPSLCGCLHNIHSDDTFTVTSSDGVLPATALSKCDTSKKTDTNDIYASNPVCQIDFQRCGALSPLGCTSDLKYSYGYEVATVWSVFTDAVKDAADFAPKMFKGLAKRIIMIVAWILLAIAAVFLAYVAVKLMWAVTKKAATTTALTRQRQQRGS
jgi:hypothetical protein